MVDHVGGAEVADAIGVQDDMNKVAGNFGIDKSEKNTNNDRKEEVHLI